ncbi:MAG: ABC transporter substrate-binding protein [Paenibacillaceae bacterium]|nr:ABC transporter substrate-binding protein [Paenibacillaceae bacterium]
MAAAWKRGGLLASGLLLLLLLLSSCGTSDKPSTAGSASTPGPSIAPAATAAASQQPSATPAATKRTVKHAFGETVIPAQPKRITSIALEDMLLSLEVPLVQANGMEGYYLYDKLKQQQVSMFYVGTGINYETLLSAQPELIIAIKSLVPDQATYDKLSQIAPTIVYDRDQWRTSIVEIGQALGKEANAAAVIKAYDDKLKAAKETIVRAVGMNKSVALTRPSEKDIQIFLPPFAYGSVLYNDLGLVPAPFATELQNKAEKGTSASSLSLEKLPDIDADYLFVTAGGSLSLAGDFQKALETVSGVEQLQLWKTIPAVKQNHFFKLSARHWMLSGPIADSMKIDDVVAAVTGQPLK